MRTDPTDNGGLFIGRRPGTAPIHYRELPNQGSTTRQRADGILAAVMLATQVVINLLFWGPIPAGALWIASQAQYVTGSVSVGIALGFAVLLAVLFGLLAVLKRIDHAWVLVRRAAGHDQRTGVIAPVFATCAVIGASAFLIWLVFIGGLGSTMFGNG